MRFWITKNSDISVRDQIIRQVILGIVSEDLPVGQRLPSIRALAQRYKIHPNTASAAYHSLCAQGWLELRRGSGLYVCGIPHASQPEDELTARLRKMLVDVRKLGHRQEEVLSRLKQIIEPKRFTQIVILESDSAMGEILCEELRSVLSLPIQVAPLNSSIVVSPGTLFVTLPTRLESALDLLPTGTLVLALRMRSVSGSLETEKKPPRNALIAIASRSNEFRGTATQVLLAAGIPSVCLLPVDPSIPEWRERISSTSIAIVDAVVNREVLPAPTIRLFRIVADECLSKLREMLDSSA